MKMLVITKDHPRSKPYPWGLMECEVEGSRISTGDYLAKSTAEIDVSDEHLAGYIEVENRLIKMALNFSHRLFVDPKDMP